MAKYCAHCGKPIREFDAVCPNCGRLITDMPDRSPYPTEPPMPQQAPEAPMPPQQPEAPMPPQQPEPPMPPQQPEAPMPPQQPEAPMPPQQPPQPAPPPQEPPQPVPPQQQPPRHNGPPRTIGELRAYAEAHNWPLRDMRFFIGEDCREARAFGIFQRGGEFVVYKNKSDGSRAIRYQGPDEAFAVNELFQKMRSEVANQKAVREARYSPTPPKKKRRGLPVWAIIFIIVFAFWLIGSFARDRRPKRGYYHYGNDYYYYQTGDWYYYDDYYDDWYEIDPPDAFDDGYGDYYVSSGYDYGYGVDDFRDSDYYYESDSYYDSDSGSSWDDDDDWWDSDSDWDSGWDSGYTDWDSDW